MDEYKKLTIITSIFTIDILGKHRPDMEKSNWHYYETSKGKIYHFRKEHMVAVIERDDSALVMNTNMNN